jgi:hypothetical protein
MAVYDPLLVFGLLLIYSTLLALFYVCYQLQNVVTNYILQQ